MKKTKKAPEKTVKKTSAKKTIAPKLAKRTKRKCGRCGRVGFNSRTCDGSPKSHD